MPPLAQLPELVGFFSYSRDDDEAFRRSLSTLRDAIQRNLSARLGRGRRDFRLWQDQEAIASGKMWASQIAKAIEQAVFFIPIITPRAVKSKHCKFEFDAFLRRERELGRNDLVFPIHYIEVPELLDEAEWRADPVLSVVAKRQYQDWLKYRNASVNTPAYRRAIDGFCGEIAKTLRERSISPEERREWETEARSRAEAEERVRQEAEAKRRAPKGMSYDQIEITSGGRTYLLDLASQQLLDEKGKPVALTRQNWALLRYLVEKNSRLIEKNDLQEKIWKSRAITDETISAAVGNLRSALKNHEVIRTEYGHGFRFMGDVKKITVEQPKPSHVSQLQIATIEDVRKWRWDKHGHQLLEELIQLDWETTDGLTEPHEGTPQQWGPIFMQHPETWRMVIDKPMSIVGYWHFAPLFKAEYNLAKAGTLLDSQIELDTIDFFRDPGVYDMYFVQACVLVDYRHLPADRLLLEAFFEVLDRLSSAGTFFREITANAYTQYGRSLCKHFKMQPLHAHAQHGEIYSAPVGNLLVSSVAARFPDLRRRYAENGLALAPP